MEIITDTKIDNLLLKIPSDQTDSTTRLFLRKYCNVLLRSELPKGQWQAFPPTPQQAEETIYHSLYYPNHPFLVLPATPKVLLHLVMRENFANTQTFGLKYYYISLLFETENDTKACFQYLTDYFLLKDYIIQTSSIKNFKILNIHNKQSDTHYPNKLTIQSNFQPNENYKYCIHIINLDEFPST